jgi:hypothetical protein
VTAPGRLPRPPGYGATDVRGRQLPLNGA